MPSAVETLCERAAYWAEEANLGYDQTNRWDIRPDGECDCASLAYWVAWEAGLAAKPADYRSRTLYTGTIARDLVAAGWQRLAPSISALMPGDYLLSEYHHVAICVHGYGWGSTLAEANIDERGRTTGGQTGDQTARETRLVHVYEYSAGWDCILRPPSGSGGHDGLEVDGWLGTLSVMEWQRQLGTPADGMVSGQPLELAEWWPRLASVEFGHGGSSLVRAIQRKVSAPVDGYLGPKTVKALQLWLAKAGYFVGEVDGILGPNTAKAVQRSLNDRAWS